MVLLPGRTKGYSTRQVPGSRGPNSSGTASPSWNWFALPKVGNFDSRSPSVNVVTNTEAAAAASLWPFPSNDSVAQT
eukprot:1675210-Rhodomonas_salina.1